MGILATSRSCEQFLLLDTPLLVAVAILAHLLTILQIGQKRGANVVRTPPREFFDPPTFACPKTPAARFLLGLEG